MRNVIIEMKPEIICLCSICKNRENTLYKDALKSLSVFFCDIRVYYNNGFKFKVRFL